MYILSLFVYLLIFGIPLWLKTKVNKDPPPPPPLPNTTAYKPLSDLLLLKMVDSYMELKKT